MKIKILQEYQNLQYLKDNKHNSNHNHIHKKVLYIFKIIHLSNNKIKKNTAADSKSHIKFSGIF